MRPIKESEIEQIAKLITDSFIDYPLYDVVFPDEKTRWKALYASAVVRIFMRQSYTLVNDELTRVIMAKRPGDREKSPWSLIKKPILFFKCLVAFPLCSFALMKEYGKIDEQARAPHYNPETDIHFQLTCAEADARGASDTIRIMEEICADYPVYCETHSSRNVRLFHLMNFETVEQIEWRGITHYGLRAEKMQRSRPKPRAKETAQEAEK